MTRKRLGNKRNRNVPRKFWEAAKNNLRTVLEHSKDHLEPDRIGLIISFARVRSGKNPKIKPHQLPLPFFQKKIKMSIDLLVGP